MIWLISLYASKDQCVTPTTTLFQRLQFSCSRFNSTVSIQLLLFGYLDYHNDGNVGNDNYVAPATNLIHSLQFSCSRFNSPASTVSTVSIQFLLFGYLDYHDDGNVGNNNYVTPATTLFHGLQFSWSRFMRKMYEFSHWMDMWRACCNLLDGTFATRTRKTNIFILFRNILS